MEKHGGLGLKNAKHNKDGQVLGGETEDRGGKGQTGRDDETFIKLKDLVGERIFWMAGILKDWIK